jgi:NDP-sugar pyrophosphorylase family protein
VRTAAILAGGLAARLGALARDTPKALIDCGGIPFLALQLALLARNGVREAVLCTGHLGERIEDFVRGRDLGVSVRCVSDGERLLGTGGALVHARPFLPERFWVLYGDSYLDADYAPAWAAFESSGAKALMTVIRNRGRWGPSNAAFDGRRVSRYDKARPGPDLEFLDYGLLALDREALSGAPPERPLDLAGMLGGLASRGELAGFEMERPLFEVGSPDGLSDLRRHLAGGGRR